MRGQRRERTRGTEEAGLFRRQRDEGKHESDMARYQEEKAQYNNEMEWHQIDGKQMKAQDSGDSTATQEQFEIPADKRLTNRSEETANHLHAKAALPSLVPKTTTTMHPKPTIQTAKSYSSHFLRTRRNEGKSQSEESLRIRGRSPAAMFTTKAPLKSLRAAFSVIFMPIEMSSALPRCIRSSARRMKRAVNFPGLQYPQNRTSTLNDPDALLGPNW
jgi:hypothetical protein